MAVLAMKRINVCAPSTVRKPMMELIQRRGEVELCDDLPRDDVFSRANVTASSDLLRQNTVMAEQALEALDKYAPQKTGLFAGLEGKAPLKEGQLTACVKNQTAIREQARTINALAKEIAESEVRIAQLKAQITELEPWMDLGVPLDFDGTDTTSALIGSLPGSMDEEAVLKALNLPEDIPVDVQIVSSSKSQTCLLVLCFDEDKPAVDDALRATAFALPAISCRHAPAEEKRLNEAEIAQTEKAIAEKREKLVALASARNDIRLLIDYYTIRYEKYESFDKLAASEHVILLSGWITEKASLPLKAQLEDRFDAVVEISDPLDTDDPPVALSNNGFSAPMEGVLAGYSYPGKHEFDPSSMMALFYYFLFGMMLSDAGYGLLIVIACSIALAKYKGMAQGLRQSLKMFLFSGISTTFWGFMYGSFFGDAVHSVASTFFGSDLALNPIWTNPIDHPMQMLMFCLGIGVIHLFAGLGCKAYLCIRDKDFMGLFADVLSWYLLIGGLVLFALSMPAFMAIVQLSFVLPTMVGTVGGYMAAAGAVIIVLFGGRESKNPVLRLVKGLYALYGSTSWLGDILSYSRLLALGLATGVIAQVVNQMAAMGGRNVVGVIMYILVFLIGHVLNIAINMLGAYVHTNRLQFVEFFGKFYEGGGKEFTPFADNTKYFKLTEVK